MAQTFFPYQPQLVKLSVNNLSLYEDQKADLELYRQFLEDTNNRPTTLTDVLLGCALLQMSKDSSFKKWKKQPSSLTPGND